MFSIVTTVTPGATTISPFHPPAEGCSLSIGRAADNGLVISHPAVSKYHATVINQGIGWIIIDGDGKKLSANGIYIGQEKIVSLPLTPGISVTLARQTSDGVKTEISLRRSPEIVSQSQPDDLLDETIVNDASAIETLTQLLHQYSLINQQNTEVISEAVVDACDQLVALNAKLEKERQDRLRADKKIGQRQSRFHKKMSAVGISIAVVSVIPLLLNLSDGEFGKLEKGLGLLVTVMGIYTAVVGAKPEKD